MSLLDLAEDLTSLNAKDSALIAVTDISNSQSDAEHEDESLTSDTDLSDLETIQISDQTKKQAQRAAFEKYVQKRHKEEKKAFESTSNNVNTDEQEAIERESSRIIDKVRDYQQELFERAKEDNIIAVLDTGSGKTLISCLLIRHVLENERVKRLEGQKPKIVCFLANSVHLVQQQARVLDSNLIEKPAVLYGNTKMNLWSRTTWDKIKQDNKIAVCTPAILDQALSHSYLTMEEISLLVFDEAHHTKKDHPYSRLIRSYYLKCLPDYRPKIFGMTASAVDTKGDITKTATALEELLHARIVTTDDGSLSPFAPKPTDVQWTYARLHMEFETALNRKLADSVSFCEQLKRGFEFAKKAPTELGSWCADRAWAYIFGITDGKESQVPSKFEQSGAYKKIESEKERRRALEALTSAVDIVKQSRDRAMRPTRENLSSKVNQLYDQLSEHFKRNPQTRAIVFVEERLKALVLNDCFRRLDVPHIRTGTLLGIAGNAFDSTSVKEQEKTLQFFRAGLVNLVFATSVADEGLDIPQCNLCIRFDLCKTTIQYMQSRGRARMKGSIFAHMLEEGQFDQASELQYQIDNEQYLKEWCSSLPEDRKLGRGTQLAKLLAKDEGGRAFRTETGAVCDNSNALLVIARFATTLTHTGATKREIYSEEIDVDRNLFRYEVRLPASTQCKITGCRGDWKTSKQLAKRSAAWAACFLLRKNGHLSDNLDSIYRKVKPVNANAHLAVSSKQSAYDMQIKPTVWQDHLGIIPTCLYATSIRFKSDCELKYPLATIVLLTRTSLPTLPTFAIFPEEEVRTEVILEAISTPLLVTEHILRQLTVFTLDGVFSDVFNKVYAHESEKMTYWLAPTNTLDISDAKSLEDIIDYAALEVAQKQRICWEPGMDPTLWTNKFLCDPGNGKFHYFTADTVSELKPTDPNGVGRPRRKGDRGFNIAQKRQDGSILDFSDSTWSAARKKKVTEKKYDLEQPVFSADLIGHRRNFLDTATAVGFWTPCFIAPEPLQIGRIDSQFAASCLLWPAIIHRIESYMIVLEAFDKLGLNGVPADLALEAFTKDGDAEVEEEQTHASGRRGTGKNYERLEFIGDSLLKMTTTMTVFNRTTCDEEGMHCRRMGILCNRNLFDVATSEEMQLFRYARTLGFDRTTWYPEYLKLLQGRGAKKEPESLPHAPVSQQLGMKTIADMSEAIIGAAITSTAHLPLSHQRFDLGIKAITKLVRSEDHTVMSWSDIASQYKLPVWVIGHIDPVAMDRAELVTERTGYEFNHPRLLRSALTHSSDTNSNVPDLQRLEFLGDAVLDWVCISWLFNTNPTRNPQWLTEHKMAMVSNKFLAALAVTLDFDKFIFATTTKLLSDIQVYSTKVREAMAQPDCPNSFWTEIESPPKALSDLVESYLGAVLVDSGFDYNEVEKFFDKHVKHFFTNISDYDTFANRHPTTFFLHKIGQEYKCHDFSFQNTADANTMPSTDVEVTAGVLIHGKVVADARGTSARYASMRAAKQALAKLEGLSREDFRAKFDCDCAAKEE